MGTDGVQEGLAAKLLISTHCSCLVMPSRQLTRALAPLSQEFLKMMTHKILNRDPKDEILKAT